MKNNVIKLPAPDLLRWAEFAKSMSEGMIEGGCSDDEIQHVASQIKRVFLVNPYEFSIEAESTQALIEELSRRVQKLFNALMAELVKRELDLYRLRGEKTGANHDQ